MLREPHRELPDDRDVLEAALGLSKLGRLPHAGKLVFWNEVLRSCGRWQSRALCPRSSIVSGADIAVARDVGLAELLLDFRERYLLMNKVSGP